ncbi:MAG: PDZ domain-containing protein [Actinomycetota bacterium]|nr:PDZ domain-containing protein [Actinomycetota bacterium]
MGTVDPLSEDPFGDDDPPERPRRPPLPQDDRLWRHPSEIGRAMSLPVAGKRNRSRSTTAAAVVGLVVGLFTATAVMVVSTTLLGGGRPAPQVTTTRLTTPTPRVSIDKVLVQSAVARVAPSVVSVVARSSKGKLIGSGLVVSSNGLILTASGLVGAHRHISVAVPGRGVFRAVVKASDRETGLSLVAIPIRGLPPAPLSASTPKPGQLVMAMTSGHHHGLSARVGVGSVRSVGQPLPLANTVLIDTTQVDVPMAPNGAGGVLVDRGGWIVGMTLVSSSGANGTLTTAIPASLIGQDAVQLSRLGHPLRGWLGVMGVAAQVVPSDGRPPTIVGVKVTRVLKDSPAAAGGLRRGDVIETVDGQAVSSMAALEQAVRLQPPGAKVVLEVARASGETTVSAVLAEAQH